MQLTAREYRESAPRDEVAEAVRARALDGVDECLLCRRTVREVVGVRHQHRESRRAIRLRQRLQGERHAFNIQRRTRSHAQRELRFRVQHRRVVQTHAGRREIQHVDVTLVGVIGARDSRPRSPMAQRVDDTDIDAVPRRISEHRHRRLGNRVRRNRVHHVERHLFTRRITEAHLQLAVDGEQPDLIGDVREDQHHDSARSDLREIRVKLRAQADVVRREVQLARDEELAVRAELDDDLSVEDLFGGVNGENLRTARDGHGRGEGGGETIETRVRLNRAVLQDDLALHAFEPGISRHHLLDVEGRPAQCERIFNGWQRLEELHARREIIDRQARVRLQHDAARHRGVDEDPERTQLREREANRQSADARERKPALHTHEEHAILHRRRRVERADHVQVVVDLQDAADQRRVELAAEHVSADAHANRSDVDDGELAFEQQAHVDLHTLDRAGERHAAQPVQPADARGKREHKVLGMLLDVVPLDAEFVDADGQPGRPLEALACRTADTEEHAEARQRVETAIALEAEVARLAADDERANLDLCPDGTHAEQELVRIRAGVDAHILTGEREHAAELDLERINIELERVHLAVGERQAQAHGFRIRHARQILCRLCCHAIGDRRGDGTAGEELRAAGRHEDRTAELHRIFRVKIHREVRHANAQVIELQDAPEANLRGRRRGRSRRGGRLGQSRIGPAVNQNSLANREAVHSHDQARDDVRRRGCAGGQRSSLGWSFKILRRIER